MSDSLSISVAPASASSIASVGSEPLPSSAESKSNASHPISDDESGVSFRRQLLDMEQRLVKDSEALTEKEDELEQALISDSPDDEYIAALERQCIAIKRRVTLLTERVMARKQREKQSATSARTDAESLSLTAGLSGSSTFSVDFPKPFYYNFPADESYFLTQQPLSKRVRMNDQIRSPSIRLIDEAGEPLGVFLIERAKEMAKEQELDLVEVAPNARPPVCKIMDYGKYMYRQQKMERKHKAQQKQTEVKGIRISLRTGTHDLEVKAKQAKKFLAERNLVKVVLMFRGREAAHLNLGREKLDQLYKMVEEFAKIEDPAKRQGNQLIMMLAPGGGSVAQSSPATSDSRAKVSPVSHTSETSTSLPPSDES